jgi:hypothetical protein
MFWIALLTVVIATLAAVIARGAMLLLAL